jgi:hypothetical protein
LPGNGVGYIGYFGSWSLKGFNDIFYVSRVIDVYGSALTDGVQGEGKKKNNNSSHKRNNRKIHILAGLLNLLL